MSWKRTQTKIYIIGSGDTIHLMCKCGKEAETILNLLRCNLSSFPRKYFLNDICAMDFASKNYPEDKLSSTLMCGSESFNNGTI